MAHRRMDHRHRTHRPRPARRKQGEPIMSTSIDSVTSNRTVHIRGMRGGVVAIDTTAPYGIACINVDRAELIAAIETELDVIVIARTDLRSEEHTSELQSRGQIV